MPKRYQPPVRRRKAKKARPQGLLEVAAGDDHQTEAVAAVPAVTMAAAEPAPRSEERHITRDYSYVLAEVRRVAVIAGFIVAGLILTAVFLR